MPSSAGLAVAFQSSAHLAPLEEAYLAHATELRAIVGEALSLFPLRPRRHDEPGRDLTDALWLKNSVERLVAAAVVIERERGASWEQVGEAACMARQNAHRRWADHVRGWALINGRRHLDTGGSAAGYAAELDRWYAQLDPDNPHAITDGLTDNPGDRPAAAADRTQARALRRSRRSRPASRAVLAAWSTPPLPACFSSG